MALIKSKLWLSWGLWLLLAAGCGPSATETPGEEPGAEEEAPGEEPEAEADEPPQGQPYAIMETSEGDIEIKLRPDLAPKTVEHFIKLARAGFYYNTLFHRVIPGTVIQGGDPNSKDNDPYNDGQGNSGTFLSAEFSKEPFKKGTVAMARQPGNPHSASSQFFICLRRIPSWDEDYTVFGEVTEGIEVAEKMSRSPRSKVSRLKERPTARLAIKRIKIEYRES